MRPTELYAGGDSASHLTGIHWTSWGGAQATGTVAQALWADPGQSLAQGHEETAVIVAFDLRDCGGHPGYHRLEVYFPQHGQTLASVTPTGPHFDYCTGATVTTP